MYTDRKIWLARSDKNLYLLPTMANRHGLIAGATGTGKTITMKVLAESFSDMGVPVFLADVKGDLTGMCKPGQDSDDMRQRVERFGLEGFTYQKYPTRFWDIFGEKGIPVRVTVSSMGPTLLARLLMFPLSIKQQKSTARMSAFQPMMQEIQKKYANDKQRQNEEMMKLQQDAGFSMTAGCLPMVINMFVIFGVIEVVYRPLQYVLLVSKDVINEMVTLANETLGTSLDAAHYTVQNALINLVKQNPETFSDLLGDKLDSVVNFNFTFFGIDLSQVPSEVGFFSVAIIIPVLSVLTMILVNVVTMSMSGQQMSGSMKFLPWAKSIMFGFITFTVPVGFSLYYTASNVFALAQSIVLKKMYNPEKIKQQVQEEIEAKRAERKKKKQVKVVAADGAEVVKDVSQAELDRIRLERARQMEDERYKDE